MKNNKIRQIYEAIKENGRTLNLHEIKAITGVGNGYNNSYIKPSNLSDSSHKFENTNCIVTDVKTKINLHKIKAQTGAGNGHKHNNIVNIINKLNYDTIEDYTHKSHKINEILTNATENLNLHQIKALTGAGSGYRQ